MGSLPEHKYTDAELERMHKQTCFGCVPCLRAENARLQADLKVAQHHWKACEVGWNKAIKQVEDFVRERDGYKALAEQRMEALRLLKLTQAILHGYACQQEDDCLEACEMTRTFLADTSACDAETAVLVVALKAYTDDSGWHAREMGPLGPTHDKLYRDGLAALLDPSPAAAALLAQGDEMREALKPFAAVLEGMPEVTDDWPDTMKLGVLVHLVPTIGDYRRARSALAPGEE